MDLHTVRQTSRHHANHSWRGPLPRRSLRANAKALTKGPTKVKNLVAALALLLAAVATHAAGSHARKGHFKKDGTYVAPSHATNPNKSKRDNYGSKGNTNPYTGKEGTKDPDSTKPRKP